MGRGARFSQRASSMTILLFTFLSVLLLNTRRVFTSPETTKCGQHRSLLWLCFCVKRVYFFIFLLSFQNHLIKKTLEYWKRKKAAQKGAHLPRRYLCAHDRSKHVFSIDGDEFLFSFVVLRAVFVGNVGNARASLAVFSSVERRVGKNGSVRAKRASHFILFLVL